MSKVLILSVTAGNGHNAAANAVKTQLTAAGAQCDILDVYQYASPAMGKIISRGYVVVSEKAKYMYSAGYRISEKRRGGTGESSFARSFSKGFSEKIYDYIADYKPDAVVFTHPFAGMIMDIAKHRHPSDTKVVGVLTDFVFHPYWEECRSIDYIVVASDLLTYQAQSKGIQTERLLPYGIPISAKFAKQGDKAATRRELGLAEDRPTVLVMGGSMGYGHMNKTIQSIDSIDLPGGLQIICVCGTAEKLYRQVSAYAKKSRCRILTLGFVDYVDRLMDAADCIVSKPGGLTTSEALAKRLPMIIVDPIPGQEIRNTSFLLNQGVAMATTTTITVAELIDQLFRSPTRVATMQAAIDALRHPDSARRIAGFVLDLCEGKE